MNAAKKLSQSINNQYRHISELQDDVIKAEARVQEMHDEHDYWTQCKECGSKDICYMDQTVWCESCYAEEVTDEVGHTLTGKVWGITNWTIKQRMKDGMEILHYGDLWGFTDMKKEQTIAQLKSSYPQSFQHL